MDGRETIVSYANVIKIFCSFKYQSRSNRFLGVIPSETNYIEYIKLPCILTDTGQLSLVF